MSMGDRLRKAWRAITLSDFPEYNRLVESTTVAAGIAVTERTALTNAAFWSGVSIIASQVAALPRIVYRRLENDERERATTHPVYRLLHAQPNPHMSDVIMWETLMAHALTWGNAYAEIEWDRSSRPIALWPITPDLMEPVIDGETLRYRYRGAKLIDAVDILHIPGLGFDGLKGYSVVSMARQSLGLSMAAEKFGAAFFGNGALPGLVLEHPKSLRKDTHDRLLKSWEDIHKGPDRAHRAAILEDGMKASKIGIPPEDAQFLETRTFQVSEIARWLNIPARKLKLETGTAPTTPEAGQIEFLTDTLRPWLVRIEQELNRKLFPTAQQGTYYVEHKVDAILRMDGKARAESYKLYLDMGVLDAEQIAAMESLPKPKPKPEPAAPPAPAAGNPPDPTDGDPARSRVNAAQRALVVDVVGRFMRREADKVRRAVKKRGTEALQEADLAELYAGEVPVLRGYLEVPARLAAALSGSSADASEVARTLADRYVARSKDELLSLNARNVEEAAERMLLAWETLRPIVVADELLALTEE